MQLIISLVSPDNGTGIQIQLSFTRMLYGFNSFDKMILDRIRARGFTLVFLFIMITCMETYMDISDIEVRDTEPSLSKSNLFTE